MSELSEHPQDVADREGLDLVLPEPNELFVDADDAESLVALAAGMKVLVDNSEDITEVKRTTSRSGNTHVYLRVGLSGGPLTPLIAVALQACLGSDRKRELLSLLRIVRGYDIPSTCFFEVKVTR